MVKPLQFTWNKVKSWFSDTHVKTSTKPNIVERNIILIALLLARLFTVLALYIFQT